MPQLYKNQSMKMPDKPTRVIHKICENKECKAPFDTVYVKQIYCNNPCDGQPKPRKKRVYVKMAGTAESRRKDKLEEARQTTLRIRAICTTRLCP